MKYVHSFLQFWLPTAPTAQEIARQQLAETKRLQAAHEAKAKHHNDLARYYRELNVRLSSFLQG